MKPRAIKTTIVRAVALITAVAIIIVLYPIGERNINAAVKQRRIERLNAAIENIYTTDYQQMADETLSSKREAAEATLDEPFVTDNPYGTNTTSLYVYFTTETATSVSYTVHAEGYPDFSATANQGEDFSTTHEFVVLGLIPKADNTITFTLRDENGATVASKTINHQGPSLLGEEEVRLEQPMEPSSPATQTVGNGLYAILGNDSDDQDFMYYYDVNGVVRGEVPVKFYRSHRLLFHDDLMWFSASTHTMVGMNRLGKLEKILDLGDQFILHHDYALDAQGDIVLLATDLTRSDHAVQDQVIKLDTESGKVTQLLDLGTMFADYKALTDHSGIDESDSGAKSRWDWIHCNTIQLLDDGSALLSARETSTIIKIANIETNPELQYMIGESSVWNNTSYQSSFLTKLGDFSDTGGQHSITFSTDDSLGEGQYYLTLFDNGFGYAMTRPDYDWTTVSGISTSQNPKDENSRSHLRKYLVDERAGTYSEVNSFDVPYSPYVSSVQEIGDNLNLVDSGMQGLFGIYDNAGNLQAQYSMKLASSYIYRVYLYDFQGFYFA
ncbi:aryl-sulfate sulfotransferase [Bifidobacterium panos]|uniref:Aryl-sulfate sulfotransferase n=1 Tax=Bifidobacterium panos TaxID=2675321 RepID=A0ABX1SV71_9BIFI|nr:aryl-sulfate sulfotransferase [Bifidobacterium sp. DSM 109963]NMN01726.1 aryl-sulfate sulfotransferase [Bifidobacterium sp. DSM 109963]